VCYEDSDGQMVIFCPNCKGPKPTLAITVNKGQFGVFYCKSCHYGRGKYVPHLLAKFGHDEATTLEELEAINNEAKKQ
jgi:uncharacterized protein YbaR (Trm112 family)